MDWKTLLLGALIGAILAIPFSVLGNLATPWVKSYFEKSKLTIRERKIYLLKTHYLYIKRLYLIPEIGHYVILRRIAVAGIFGFALLGWGLFNVVEGVVDHLLLGIHHVNETVPREQWIWWDLAFLLWGAAMIAGGWWLWRGGAAPRASSGMKASRR